MTCKEAKQYNIHDLLARLNIYPAKEKGNSFWYHSPFRKDKKPSFVVDVVKNIWSDLGERSEIKNKNLGGDIINLTELLFNTNTKEALIKLSNIFNAQTIETPQSFFFEQQNYLVIKPENVQTLQHKALIQYVISRNIPLNIARLYLQEAYYKVNDRKYFSVCFKNDSGGYELRNSICKNSSHPKDITTINPGQKSVNIFEGFFDFLSALVYYKISKPNNTTIVLNTVNKLDKTISYLKQFDKINSYLDTDDSGEKTTKKLVSEFNFKVKDYSKLIYPNKKDFNEYLISL